MGDKDSLSNTGSKVCGFGSLCQTGVRIIEVQIVCYWMEELVTLHYGNFTILGERARDFTWCTSCSNGVAERTPRTQIFLAEMRTEHLGWTTALNQEWGLFLLECLLHNTTAMQKKEHLMCSLRSQAEETEEMAPEHPSMSTPIGATDDAIIPVAEEVYRGEWTLGPSVLSQHHHDDCMREL